MTRRPALILMMTALAVPAHLSAHHSFSAEYEGSKTVSVEGIVTQFRFSNPHALLSLDVTDATGKTVKWTVEFSSSVSLDANGWKASVFKKGDRVTVTGNPARSEHPRMYFSRVVFADGRELVAPAVTRLDTVEEVRRRRVRDGGTFPPSP